jgi:hypothetical protein
MFLGPLAAVVLAVAAAPASALDDLRLMVTSGSTAVAPGQTVTVTLNVANLSRAINGVQALVRYDPAILTLTDAVPTDLGLTPPDEGWVEVIEGDTAGDVIYTVVLNGGSTSLAHAVATFTFAVVGEGTTSVLFRPDSPPFFTKLTAAGDNSTILPTKMNTAAITSSCDDGLFCNGLETFDGVACQPGVDPCEDGVGCTDDSCNDATDTCTNAPNDANCDDTLFCNGAETCDALLDCQPGTFPCDDSVACTDDSCDDLADSCTHLPNDANCDNGLYCDGAETCDALLDCQPGFDPCDDGIDCTVDSCDEPTTSCTSTPNDAFCDNGVFCDGAETCDPLLDCQLSSDPCAPLFCDEGTDSCFAPIHVAGVEAYYAGRFRQCQGGADAGQACTGAADCDTGICREAGDPNYDFLAAGSAATADNVTRNARGVTGVRVLFDAPVVFASTPAAAFSFEWTTGTGTTFAAVSDAAANITLTPTLENGNTVVSITMTAGYVRSRWLRVSIDATQVTASGVQLDGELDGNPLVLPSGDGTPGGNAVFYVGNMAGDINGDRKTSLSDVGLVRQQVNPALVVPIGNVFDVDKDGKVQLTDVGLTRSVVNPAFTLPLISP